MPRLAQGTRCCPVQCSDTIETTRTVGPFAEESSFALYSVHDIYVENPT